MCLLCLVLGQCVDLHLFNLVLEHAQIRSKCIYILIRQTFHQKIYFSFSKYS